MSDRFREWLLTDPDVVGAVVLLDPERGARHALICVRSGVSALVVLERLRLELFDERPMDELWTISAVPS